MSQASLIVWQVLWDLREFWLPPVSVLGTVVITLLANQRKAAL